MIEFTQDGPFAEKADHLFPDRVRILGLGQTGAAVCDQLVLHGKPGQDLWVFDSDQLTVEGSVVPNRHLLGNSLVHGLGCSGDLDLAREIAVREEDKLVSVVRGCDFLILALGLAGATGVALAERIIELASETEAKVIVVGVQPFGFEGWVRREKSVKAIANLRKEADSVLVLSHDRLAQDPATVKNIRHGFHLMHGLMAKTTQALSQVVCKRGLIQLSFADVRALYARYAGAEALENCWVGHVEGNMRDCPEDLVAELLESPLLNDESIWKQVDHAIVTVSGTRRLGLSDVQEMVTVLKDRLPVNIPIATSASLEEENTEKVRMSVMLAMTAPVTVETTIPMLPAEKKSRPISETVALPAIEKIVPPVASIEKPERPATKPARPSKAKPVPVEEPAPVMMEEESFALDPELVTTSARTAQRFVAKQEEMQFEAPTRGRFEKTHETMYRGENLDQPTFRRRGLKVKI